MSGSFVLVASYPKSGNTWTRIVLEWLLRGASSCGPRRRRHASVTVRPATSLPPGRAPELRRVRATPDPCGCAAIGGRAQGPTQRPLRRRGDGWTRARTDAASEGRQRLAPKLDKGSRWQWQSLPSGPLLEARRIGLYRLRCSSDGSLSRPFFESGRPTPQTLSRLISFAGTKPSFSYSGRPSADAWREIR